MIALCFRNCLYLLSVFKEVLPGWKALLTQLYGKCTYWVPILSFIYELSRIGKPIGIENRLWLPGARRRGDVLLHRFLVYVLIHSVVSDYLRLHGMQPARLLWTVARQLPLTILQARILEWVFVYGVPLNQHGNGQQGTVTDTHITVFAYTCALLFPWASLIKHKFKAKVI